MSRRQTKFWIGALVLAGAGISRSSAADQPSPAPTYSREIAPILKAHNLATLLGAMGRLDDALRHFRKAIVLRPGHSESHNNLGAVLQAQGQIDEAIEQFRRALALDPENVQARGNLERALALKR